MNLRVINGNIFTTDCQVIVNTINCVGVMGAGIALECRLRYPDMYKKYILLCKNNNIDIGLLWIYKSTDKWVLNFPTKRDWKHPSKKEYLHQGLSKFVKTYAEKGIESIAFPLLGADKGGIQQEESLEIMKSYLEDLSIKVEIYRYDPKSKDDLYEKTKLWLFSNDLDFISSSTKLRKDYVVKVINAMQSNDITQLNQLARIDGIGLKTLEKIFVASTCSPNQRELF
ncbi:macro domain-containing protein [Moritella dasanensis]|uniref:macro domain-containing protein n=1 Tax=Moritella dasanensis TaxID=428031 RepID=UPI0002EF71BC|nr:macro domain-containing protein [Moritella dasanensis]